MHFMSRLSLRSLPVLAIVLTPLPALAKDQRVCPPIQPATQPSGQLAPTATRNTRKTWLLHLPGISGETGLDQGMIRGLKEGGYDGAVETYNWTGENAGLGALLASQRNHQNARNIADLIAQHFHANPSDRIVLTSHSAGAGLCAWALEALPEDVKVDTVLLLSPALSPTYDLTKALRHISGHAYAFTSPNDVAVLAAGTKLFGTIDGKHVVAAGEAGFTRPEQGDPEQYSKLVAKPYDNAYLKYDNIGDHVGMMTEPFARAILAPVILGTDHQGQRAGEKEVARDSNDQSQTEKRHQSAAVGRSASQAPRSAPSGTAKK